MHKSLKKEKKTTPRLKAIFSGILQETSIKKNADDYNKSDKPETIKNFNNHRTKTLKLESIGSSMQALMARQNTSHINPYERNEEIEETSEHHLHKDFTISDFRRQWVNFSNSLPQADIADSQRMKQMNLHISEYPVVEVDVPNRIVLKRMNQKKNEIESYIRRALQNDDLTIIFKEVVNSTMGLTDAERWSLILKNNSYALLLRNTLNLELE